MACQGPVSSTGPVLRTLRARARLQEEAISRPVEAGLTDQQIAAISGRKYLPTLKRYTNPRAKNFVEHLKRAWADTHAD